MSFRTDSGRIRTRIVANLGRLDQIKGSLLVADRGLLSLENIDDLTALAERDGCKLEFTLAVPACRYADLVETFRGLVFDEDGLAESGFADHRLIVAHDPLRAAEQSDRRRARIATTRVRTLPLSSRKDATS